MRGDKAGDRPPEPRPTANGSAYRLLGRNAGPNGPGGRPPTHRPSRWRLCRRPAFDRRLLPFRSGTPGI